ncbi:MAG: hypothetical protein ACPG4K_00880, partial [Haloferula sp.]
TKQVIGEAEFGERRRVHDTGAGRMGLKTKGQRRVRKVMDSAALASREFRSGGWDRLVDAEKPLPAMPAGVLRIGCS